MVARHARRSPRVRRVALWGAFFVVVVAVVAVGSANVLTSAVDTTTSTGPVATSSTTTTTVVSNISISAVGDTELGNSPQVPADPSAYLAPIRAALAAPIVFGNLEGTMTNASSSKCAATSTDCYAFRVPMSFARIYRQAGFSVLNSANNHSHDFGEQGAIDTTTALRAAGIVQAGLPGQIGITREGTVKVAFVDFAPYSNTNDLLNLTAARQLIVQARRMAEVVVVYMHAGAEGSSADHVTRASEFYVGEDRGNPYAFAHAAVDDGASLVIASGPHVLRGMEWYRGHLIDYSMGDFANYENFASFSTLSLSEILHVTLTSAGTFVRGSVTSVRLTSAGQPFVDPTHAAASFVNQLSHEDFGAAAALIRPDGAIVAPR